jgi:ATP-dependent Clp protease ATP-binding subunit ClpX
MKDKEWELAVIFEPKELEDGTMELVPNTVITGYYDEVMDNFIGDEGNTYWHILMPYDNVKQYAYRIPVVEFVKRYRNKSLKQIKRKYLSEHLKYKYIPTLDEYNRIIILIDKVTNEEFVFEDKDSILYDYDEEMFTETDGDKGQEPNRPKKTPKAKSSINKINEKRKALPKDVLMELYKTVKGQDEFLKTIVTTIWVNLYSTGNKRNMLVMGPTGVGKTLVFETLSKILGLPILVTSTSGMSQVGYKGGDLTDILSQYIVKYGKDSNMDKGIIILDEFDKLAYKGEESGSVSTMGIQNELLKIIEGNTYNVKIGQNTYIFDTNNITFVCCGAFQELYEVKTPEKSRIGFGTIPSEKVDEENQSMSDKLVSYGLKREIVGRLPIVLQFNALTKDNLKDIILNSKTSELQEYIRILKEFGIENINIDDLVDIIVNDAMERKIGARGLTSSIVNMFNNIMYEVFNNPGEYDTLYIGPNILNNPNDFTLSRSTYKNTNEKVKVLAQ